jgi:hypothetical protein
VLKLTDLLVVFVGAPTRIERFNFGNKIARSFCDAHFVTGFPLKSSINEICTRLFLAASPQQAPREGVSATGASRLQEFISAVLPQALPNLVSQSLYMLDVNLRSSTVLGIVGGGGIGFLLISAIRGFETETVGAIALVIFVIVYAIKLLGAFVRRIVE